MKIESDQSAKMKWHPGHYQMMKSGPSSPKVQQALRGPHFVGVVVELNWGDVEPRRRQYDFRELDAWLRAAAANRKHVLARVWNRGYRKHQYHRLPEWLYAQGGTARKKKGGYQAKIWEPAIMDHVIALHQVIGRRYNSNPWFEVMIGDESSMQLAVKVKNIMTKLRTQLMRLAKATKKAMPNTLYSRGMGWWNGDVPKFNGVAGLNSMAQQLANLGDSGITSSDLCVNRNVTVYDTYRRFKGKIALMPSDPAPRMTRESIPSPEKKYLFAVKQVRGDPLALDRKGQFDFCYPEVWQQGKEHSVSHFV